MKNFILLTILLFTLPSISQEPDELSILESDATWRKEIITFPINWAPDMTLEGFEELRFSPEWDKEDNSQFWSLVLAWSVKTEKQLTLKDIESNIESYFDGLMKPNDSTIIIPKVNVLFIETEATENSSKFIGKIKMFDDFHTKKMITLNILISQHFCKKENNSKMILKK